MNVIIALAAMVLTFSFALGLIRVFKGPAVEDRMMSVQLVGTTGVGLLLLMANLLDMPASIDVALVLALLAAVSVAALTRREREPDHE